MKVLNKGRCYFGCENDVTLHKFPSAYDSDTFEKWHAVLDLEDQMRDWDIIQNTIQLCDRHFSYEDTMGTSLQTTAVPTLNCVHQSQRKQNIYVNSVKKTDKVRNLLMEKHSKHLLDVHVTKLAALERNIEDNYKAIYRLKNPSEPKQLPFNSWMWNVDPSFGGMHYTDLSSAGASVEIPICEQTNKQDDATANLQERGSDGDEDNFHQEEVDDTTSSWKNLEKFLNFPTPVVEEENAESSSSDDESVEESLFDGDNEENKTVPGKNKGDRIHFMSRMEFCKEWLKHSEITGYEQDRRLYNFVTSKVGLDSVIESGHYIKKLISKNSFLISELWRKSGRNQEVLFSEYSDWLTGPPIKFRYSVLPLKPKPLYSQNPHQHSLNQMNQHNDLLQNLQSISVESNGHVFNVLKNSKPSFKAKGFFVVVTNIAKEMSNGHKMKLAQFCKRYVSDMKFKWMSSNNDEAVFNARFHYWLSLSVKWPAFLKEIMSEKYKAKEKVSNPKNPPDKLTLKDEINILGEELTRKCSDAGLEDVSKAIHRLIHPEEAVITGAISSENCKETENITLCDGTQSDVCMNPETDPLMIDDDDQMDAINTDQNPSISPQISHKTYETPSEIHQSKLMVALQKLRAVITDTERTKNRENTERTDKEATEFGPVLEKILFIKKCNVKSGTLVKLHGREWIAMNVSNLKQATALVPKFKTKKSSFPNSKSILAVPNAKLPLSNFKGTIIVPDLKSTLPNSKSMVAFPNSKSSLLNSKTKVTVPGLKSSFPDSKNVLAVLNSKSPLVNSKRKVTVLDLKSNPNFKKMVVVQKSKSPILNSKDTAIVRDLKSSFPNLKRVVAVPNLKPLDLKSTFPNFKKMVAVPNSKSPFPNSKGMVALLNSSCQNLNKVIAHPLIKGKILNQKVISNIKCVPVGQKLVSAIDSGTKTCPNNALKVPSSMIRVASFVKTPTPSSIRVTLQPKNIPCSGMKIQTNSHQEARIGLDSTASTSCDNSQSYDENEQDLDFLLN